MAKQQSEDLAETQPAELDPPPASQDAVDPAPADPVPTDPVPDEGPADPAPAEPDAQAEDDRKPDPVDQTVDRKVSLLMQIERHEEEIEALGPEHGRSILLTTVVQRLRDEVAAIPTPEPEPEAQA